MRKLLPLLLVAALLPACESTQPPKAMVTSTAVTDSTDEGSRIEFIVELDNPQDENFPLVEAYYTVSVEDAGSFTFTELPVEALPAKGIQQLKLAAALPEADLEGRTYRISGHVSYKPDGEIRAILTESGVPLPTATFSASGTLSGGVIVIPVDPSAP